MVLGEKQYREKQSENVLCTGTHRNHASLKLEPKASAIFGKIS